MKKIRVIWNWIVLGWLFFQELFLSVWDVVLTVIRPSRVKQSAVVAVPLDVKSDAGIALFANIISLTPGTTSIHISEDRATLYVHVMNYSPEIVQKFKSGFERRVMEVLP